MFLCYGKARGTPSLMFLCYGKARGTPSLMFLCYGKARGTPSLHLDYMTTTKICQVNGLK